MVHFADYVYSEPIVGVLGVLKHLMPGIKDGTWGYFDYGDRHIDRDKFEQFKTRFYTLQGWETTTGYPTRPLLNRLGLGYVADELKQHGKLGKG